MRVSDMGLFPMVEGGEAGARLFAGVSCATGGELWEGAASAEGAGGDGVRAVCDGCFDVESAALEPGLADEKCMPTTIKRTSRTAAPIMSRYLL